MQKRPSWVRRPAPKRPRATRDEAARNHAQAYAKAISPVSSLEPDRAGEDENWTLSYADLVTLLLTLFVVMSAFAIFNGRQSVSMAEVVGESPSPSKQVEHMTVSPAGPVVEAAEQTGAVLARRQHMIEEVRRGVDALRIGAKVEIHAGTGRIDLDVADDSLFESGAARLTWQGRRLLERMAPMLDGTGLAISVIGHTDDVPIASAVYPTNWELSAARASRVVRYLEGLGLAPPRLEAIGRAHTEPRASNATPRGRAQNRRVSLSLKLGTAVR